MKTTLPSFLLLLVLAFGQAQNLQYEVLLGDKNIGKLEVLPSNLNHDDYTISMKANMSLPFTSVRSSFDVTFQNGTLFKSEMMQKMNDKVREHSVIERNGNHYKMDINGEQKTMKGDITYSVVQLYHFEPKDRDKVFSERFGAYATITELEPHYYEISFPDGNNNKYRYENGICVEMTTRHTLAKVTFQLKNSSKMIGE